MGCYPPRPSIEEEAVFGMYITNLLCVVKKLPPFEEEDMEQKRRERLDDFYSRVNKVLGNKKWTIGVGEYAVPDKKDHILQKLCDEILDILFSRRNDLKNITIKGDGDGDSEYLLFLDKFFAFLLSEENLSSFINLIFSLISGGTIFSKAEDDEKAREWLDNFKL